MRLPPYSLIRINERAFIILYRVDFHVLSPLFITNPIRSSFRIRPTALSPVVGSLWLQGNMVLDPRRSMSSKILPILILNASPTIRPEVSSLNSTRHESRTGNWLAKSSGAESLDTT
jgi:hypothetical protein